MIWSIGEGANEVEAKDFVRVGKEWVGSGLESISAIYHLRTFKDEVSMKKGEWKASPPPHPTPVELFERTVGMAVFNEKD